MTARPLIPWALYAEVAPLWLRAGAGPLDAAETILEMLAIAKGERTFLKPSFNLARAELTSQAWNEMRHRLTEALELPPEEHKVTSFADRIPGLLEQTRRAVMVVASHMSDQGWPAFARAVLDLMAFAPQTGMRDTSLGYFRWPNYLAPLIKGLLGPPSEDPIYCPFDSSGWLPLILAEAGWAVRCEISNVQAARIQLLFAFIGDWNVRTHVGEPIRQPTWLEAGHLAQFNHSAAITTFGYRYKDQFYSDPYGRFPVQCHYGEALQVAHVVAQTSRRVLIVVPENFLFRTAGGERDYKEFLTRRGMLSTVVRLPHDVFAPAANVQSSILILEPDTRRAEVLFVDAAKTLSSKALLRKKDEGIARILSIVKSRRASPISAKADYNQIAEQEFNFSVDRYVRSAKEQLISRALDQAQTLELNDIAEIIRPQALGSRPQTLKPVEIVEAVESQKLGDKRVNIAEFIWAPTVVHEFREVGLQDLQPDGSVSQPAKLVDVDDRALGRAARQQLQTGDLVLSARGRIGAVGIVPEMSHDDIFWTPAQTFVILRLRSSSPIQSSVVLYRYLASPLGQQLLQSLSTGGAVPMVQMGDIKKLRVIIPTPEEQLAIEREHAKVLELRAEINELERLTAKLDASSWPMTKIAAQITDERQGDR